ncbi:glycosyltransferase family protein [Roseovarius sp.]|uniref:glycosyltransferase family protein n=1 Tax=Pseudomonadota TaxID=1224 RepID=UPI00356AFE8C
MTTTTGPTYSPKIALYSHDTMGLGHVRRNLLIAQALADSPLNASTLLIAGVREAGAFVMPRGGDCLTLPAYRKERNGEYAPRSLPMETTALAALRSQVIGAALNSFVPDLFIVDNVPRGALQELKPVLERLRDQGKTRCVLGLRDILDGPERVLKQWRLLDNEATIRDYYDAVWIYGDRSVYDATEEYAFSSDLAAKSTFTGYLDPSARLIPGDADTGLFAQLPKDLAEKGFTLCMVGGGQDGLTVTEAFARADLPADEYGVIVTGPFLPAAQKHRLLTVVRGNPRVRVLEFVSEPMPLMRQARRVIAMGGYNTVQEILCLGKRALLVPRERPRLEQTIRAERLRARCMLDFIAVRQCNPRALSAWLNHEATASLPALYQPLDRDGLKRLPMLAATLIAGPNSVPRTVPPPSSGLEGGFRHVIA